MNLSEPTQESLAPLEAVVWFNEYTELRRVSPHVATNSDAWVVIDTAIQTGEDQSDEEINTPIVGLVLVEPDYSDDADAIVHRIGVKESHRRNGIATTLLEAVHDEYGSLELECRESLPANEYYEATGWEQTGVKTGDPEDLYQWYRDP